MGIKLENIGENFSKVGSEDHGFKNLKKISWNLDRDAIYDITISNGQGVLSNDQALVVETGIHTGRSANDKFIVKNDINKDQSGGITTSQLQKRILIIFIKMF